MSHLICKYFFEIWVCFSKQFVKGHVDKLSGRLAYTTFVRGGTTGRTGECFSGPIFQFVEIRGEIFRGGGTMVAHEKNEKKDHFVSDLLLKILQFYPGLL